MTVWMAAGRGKAAIGVMEGQEQGQGPSLEEGMTGDAGKSRMTVTVVTMAMTSTGVAPLLMTGTTGAEGALLFRTGTTKAGATLLSVRGATEAGVTPLLRRWVMVAGGGRLTGVSTTAGAVLQGRAW